MHVGVTGHRKIDAYAGLDASVDAALAHLRAQGADTVVTALARGSDQLVALRALATGWTVIVLVPEDEPSYRAVVEVEGGGTGYAAVIGAEGVQLARAPVGPTDYAALGRELVDRCDVLLAVLDLRLPDGKPGGTEDVVAQAVEVGRPVLHLDPVTGLTTDDSGVGADSISALSLSQKVEAEADAQAIGSKERMRWRAIAIAALGAFAVVFAATPLAYPLWDHRAWSVAEVLALAGAFGLLAHHRRTEARADWVHARTRAELVRRERFLFVGRAGGYAISGGRVETRPAREAILVSRIAELRSVAEDKEDATIDRAYGTLTNAAKSGATLSDFEPSLVAWYRRRRVAGQEHWFSRQACARHRQALAWERGARLAGGGAALGALVVFFRWGHHGTGVALAHLAAVALPAVAAALTMVTTIMSDAVDARRYRAAARVLARFRGEPADPQFSPSTWIDQVEAFLLGEHLAWRAEMLSRDLEVS
jgi:Protein of unknown function (DUF4231)